MPKLGQIQNDIIGHLNDCGGQGYIGPLTYSYRFDGLNWNQVERSLNRLIDRGIVRAIGSGIYKISHDKITNN